MPQNQSAAAGDRGARRQIGSRGENNAAPNNQKLSRRQVGRDRLAAIQTAKARAFCKRMTRGAPVAVGPPRALISGKAAMKAERRTKIGEMRELLFDLLQEHEEGGAIPTSVRFLFYELVQRGAIAKKGKGRTDRIVSDALMNLREAGRIPWDWITDETRNLENYVGYSSIQSATLAYIENAITIDPWNGRAPLILTESRSLCGALRLLSLLLQYGCPIDVIAKALSRNSFGGASGVAGAVVDRIMALK